MMNKVIWHAVSTGALVRNKPADNATVLKSIAKGTWLGVIKEFGEWVYVIGKESIGWVSKQELSAFETRTLHIKKSDENLVIAYSI